MNKGKKFFKQSWKIIILLLVIAMMLDISYKNKLLKIETYHIKLDKIPIAFDGYRILQLSDLHNYRFGQNQIKLLKEIIELKPDIIVFTGDLVERRYMSNNNGIMLLEKLAKNYPVYFVSGNHEEALEEAELIKLKSSLINAGVVVLDNEWRIIEKGHEAILIVGLRDAVQTRWDEYGAIIEDCILDAGVDVFTVVLAHRPEFVKEYAETGIDLVLSGHTHGMQMGVEIPKWGIKFSPAKLRYKRWAGLYSSNNNYLYINRGFGFLGFPGRVGTYPEITLLNLERA